MATVALRWKYLKNGDRLMLAEKVSKAMSENPDLFPDPPVDLDIFSGQVKKFEKAEGDTLDSSPSRTTIRNNARDAVYDSLQKLGRYVQNVSKGDERIIHKAGFKAKKSSYPRTTDVLAPVIKKISYMAEGQVKLSWTRISNSYSYFVQYSITPEIESSWQDGGFYTAASAILSNLPLDQIVWFRVHAIARSGRSDWSAMISKKVI
jgi:hypothetical protein